MSFVLVLSLIIALAFYYLWRRLVISSKPSPRQQRLLRLSFIFLLLFQLAAIPLRFLLHSGKTLPLALFTANFALLGFIDILVIITLGKDFLLVLYNLYSRAEKPPTEDPSRRLFLNRLFNTLALGTAGVSTAIGSATALQMPKLKRTTIPIKNLHPSLDQFTIAQISDLHVGPLISKERVEYVVKRVNELKPDLIALTGDIGDGTVSELSTQTQPLANLKSKFGKYYVTGNHEYYWDVDAWVDRVRELGFDYLYNENRILAVGGAKLLVGGVADIMCQHIRPDHVSDPMVSIQSSVKTDLKVLLAHQPKSCFKAYDAGYDLQLSGHTHNGQFFPNSLFIRFFHPYVKGLNLHREKLWVYVSVGTGFWGPPQRLGEPAEISLLTLTKA